MEILYTIKLSFNTTVFIHIIFKRHLHTARDKNSMRNTISLITYDHTDTYILLLGG